MNPYPTKVEFGDLPDGSWAIFIDGVVVGEPFASRTECAVTADWLSRNARFVIEQSLHKLADKIEKCGELLDQMSAEDCSCGNDETRCKHCDLHASLDTNLAILHKMCTASSAYDDQTILPY